jgi:tRNA-Thr(GGU) m(6)t(6)A37 methyltransferase TsaA
MVMDENVHAVTLKAIGTIHSPFKNIEGMPIQPVGAQGIKGTIEFAAEYAEGLKDLEGFSHVILIYWLHLSAGYSLRVKPFLDIQERGVFATRAPQRPNAIGISVVRLIRVEGCLLEIEDVDIADGTPLLDIKPYIPEFDAPKADRIGWFLGKTDKANTHKADGRFKNKTTDHH